MGRQGNKYEQTVAFVVIPFVEQDGELVERTPIYLQDEFELPVSKKTYKATLKNVDVFITEYMEANPEVQSVRLDRISHIRVYER